LEDLSAGAPAQLQRQGIHQNSIYSPGSGFWKMRTPDMVITISKTIDCSIYLVGHYEGENPNKEEGFSLVAFSFSIARSSFLLNASNILQTCSSLFHLDIKQ
jgi:hypothetical protein